jgi:hypothetical protein
LRNRAEQALRSAKNETEYRAALESTIEIGWSDSHL